MSTASNKNMFQKMVHSTLLEV